MGLDLDYIDEQTPLDEDEKEGLLIPTIATRGELDEFEQQNIELALLWSLKHSFKAENVFTEEFLKTLHKRMYGNVWAWAGEFRRTNKNIGVDRWQISIELRKLLGDMKFWYANNIFSPDETTIRFKHRLVSIHCFPNGNGRHSRLMADIVIEKIYKQLHYSWGASNLVKSGDQRNAYLSAMKEADKGNIQPLINFARS
jgi:Fic-DOC domain mobile mystery protein B